jgi:hypothetical protein
VDPAGFADIVIDNTDPVRPRAVADRLVPPTGWHRTPHGFRRVVTTDAETAARINRLLDSGG